MESQEGTAWTPEQSGSPEYIKDADKWCLTKAQADHVLSAVQEGRIVNPLYIALIVQESPCQAPNCESKPEANPYEESLQSAPQMKPQKEVEDTLKMAQASWSVFTTQMTYVAPLDNERSPFAPNGNPKIMTKQSRGLPLPPSTFEVPEDIKDTFLERFDEQESALMQSHNFDDHVDIATTYLGTRSERGYKWLPQGEINLSPKSMTKGTLRDGTNMKVLFDTGATKSLMPKAFYDKHPRLHTLPKYRSSSTGVVVGNGQTVEVLFTIPIVLYIGDHLFEVYTTVTPIHDQLDLVIGLKNMVEIEGKYDITEGKFTFLGRSVPLFPSNTLKVKPGETKTTPYHIGFPEEISGFPILKMYSRPDELVTVKDRIIRNRGTLTYTNRSKVDSCLDTDTALGILDLRSMGYYKVALQALTRKLDSVCQFHHYATGGPQLQCEEQLVSPYVPEEDLPDLVFDDSYTKAEVVNNTEDPYPWLDKEDPRRWQTDEEILYEKVDLSESLLSPQEKSRLLRMMVKYREAFSLRDEIGECPNITADIKVIDDSRFYVRPFRISEEDKPFMDKQMDRLVALGILTKQSTKHTSPVMLISRKLTKDKRPVVDFRLLNSRILRRNTSIPLMSDVLSILGNSKCEVLSCCDLKDAYHSIPLTEESKEYCGIIPYFGSPILRYEVLPMGIACAPQIWMDYITMILNGLENKRNFIAIMDDLLIHSTKKEHWRLMETLFKMIIDNGLKLSPKKCQLFKTSLVYMGNMFSVKGKRMTVTPLKSRIDAIQQIPTPRTPKQCKSFCGVVNYLALFCEGLQRLLKPIQDLTRKSVPFFWGEEQESAFQEIKMRMSEAPVLHLPQATGRFLLFSDTSREHTGSSLWQVQNGKPCLLGYASKTLPHPACLNYSVTELEMTGLLINIALWKHLLKHCEFDAAVDHAAVVQIIKSKNEPATPRIMRLLERLSAYSFNLYYVKGKDMVLADYLSRHRINDEDPNDLIPISFHAFNVWVDKKAPEPYWINTRSKGIDVPEVHGATKGLDPHYAPEHQHKSVKLKQQTRDRPPPKPPDPAPRPQGPSRSGSQASAAKLVQRSKRILSQRDSGARNTPPPEHRDRLPQSKATGGIPNAPAFPTSLPRPPMDSPPDSPPDSPVRMRKRPPKQLIEPDPIPGIDTGEEETILAPVHTIPTDSDFLDPGPLSSRIDASKLIHKFLPQQGEIDRLLKQIQRKVLRDTNLPGSLKDLRAAYLTSPHFRDVYIYLLQGRTPRNDRDAKRVKRDAKDFVVLDGLLFKIGETDDDILMCIPQSKAEILLEYYHSSLFGCHQGMTKTKATIEKKFFCPNLQQIVNAYVTGCHLCQLYKKGKVPNRPFQKRINLNTPAMTKMSMDIKYMPRNKGYRFILVLMCEITNWIVAIPLKDNNSEHIIDQFQTYYLPYFGLPTHIVCDLDPVFTSTIMEAFTNHLNIKMITVSPTNHKSLQAEHGIKSLANMLKMHIEEQWSWVSVLPWCVLAYNSFTSPNLDGHSPFQLTFGREANIGPTLQVDPKVKITATFQQYYEKLKKVLGYWWEKVERFRSERTDMLNRTKDYHHYNVGQLVYVYQAKGTIVKTGSKKIACYFVGPLVIFQAVGPNQFLLMSLEGKIYNQLVEETRLKPAVIRTSSGNVCTLAELKKALTENVAIQLPNPIEEKEEKSQNRHPEPLNTQNPQTPRMGTEKRRSFNFFSPRSKILASSLSIAKSQMEKLCALCSI